MKPIIRNTLILLAITLVAGLALAVVHDITKEPIEKAEEEAKLEAYRSVYPDAASFGELTKDISSYKPLGKVTIDEVKTALDSSGSEIGWVMTVTSGSGYGGDITIALGVSKDGTVQGMTVISMSETPGLGAKCTSEDFQSQFAGIKSSKVTAVKTGKSADNEVDAISGATFTTNAVLEAVNAGLSLVSEYLMEG